LTCGCLNSIATGSTGAQWIIHELSGADMTYEEVVDKLENDMLRKFEVQRHLQLMESLRQTYEKAMRDYWADKASWEK
jgi:hypothetical protein